MTWTKLGDDFTDDPGLLALPRAVRLVHVEALVWSNRHGTDGTIPTHALPRVTDDPDPTSAAEQLVAAGKWKPAETGWEIVGFLDDQPSADDVRRTKELAKQRQRRQRQHRNGDHSLCDPQYCRTAARESRESPVTSRVTNGVSHDTPTRPVPTRPDPKDRGTGSGPGASSAAPAADPCTHWDDRRDRPHLSADGDCLRAGCGATGLCTGCVRVQRRSGADARCYEHQVVAVR